MTRSRTRRNHRIVRLLAGTVFLLLAAAAVAIVHRSRETERG